MRLIILLICLQLIFCFPALAQNEKVYNVTDWSLANEVPYRSEILSCDVFLSPVNPKLNVSDDGIGFRISSNKTEDFKQAIEQIIKEKGIEALTNGRITISGVPMGQKNKFKDQFRDILDDLGVSQDVKLRAMTVPRHLVDESATNFFENLWHDFLYMLPGYERNYQVPLKAEIKAGVLSTLPVEIPSAGAVYALNYVAAKPFLNLHITTFNHAVILTAYSTFQKTMLNWLLQPGQTYTEKMIKSKTIDLASWLHKNLNRKNMENPVKMHALLKEKIPAWGQRFTLEGTKLFIKQMGLSFPFILNYNIFGRFTELRDFLAKNGLPTWTQTMSEVGDFVVTQGLTTGLQTYFYKKVSTQRVSGWLNNIKNEEDSKLAREFVNYVKIPILVLDAAILFFASTGALPLSDIVPYVGEYLSINTAIGTFEPNIFQVGLVALTYIGDKWYSNAYLDRKFLEFKQKREAKKTDN
ncbi:MAG: hypothetical protein JNM93_03695 [Bacteriovoracaceae bacterium]|nr:hypothetical protein [Bacteriovoracaceae bacterium]